MPAQVLYFGLPAAAAAVLANSRLAALLSSSSSSSSLMDSSAAAAPDVAESAAAAAAAAQALLHVSQEAVLVALMPAAVWLALGSRVVSARYVWGCASAAFAMCSRCCALNPALVAVHSSSTSAGL
jgi:hypothetical protein